VGVSFGGIEMVPKRIIVHNQWNHRGSKEPKGKIYSHRNDIALIVLKGPVDGAMPVKIKSSLETFQAFDVILAGFGGVSGKSAGDAVLDGIGTLRKTIVTAVFFDPKSYYFFSENRSKGACPGDSGGPVLSDDAERNLFIHGLISSVDGKEQGVCGPFATLINVEFYAPWIRAQIRKSNKN
jgi:Trypsin